jgi:hypothetical protein
VLVRVAFLAVGMHEIALGLSFPRTSVRNAIIVHEFVLRH